MKKWESVLTHLLIHPPPIHTHTHTHTQSLITEHPSSKTIKINQPARYKRRGLEASPKQSGKNSEAV